MLWHERLALRDPGRILRRFERAKAAYNAERTIGALHFLVLARREAIDAGLHRSEWP